MPLFQRVAAINALLVAAGHNLRLILNWLRLFAAWLVAAQSKVQRQWGFWIFLFSNVLWVGWGWHDHAWALIILQVGLALLNIRGVAKNERA